MAAPPVSGDVIAEQEAAHQSLLGQLQDERTRTPLRQVYHYTNDVGLFEILKTGHLWLSDYTTLNDPLELQYGLRVGTELLNATVATQGNQPSHSEFIQGFYSVAARGLHATLRGYVCSLSVEPDELTQWRSYASGGSGYCLGFDSPLLDQAMTAFGTGQTGNLGYSTFEVLYDPMLLKSRMDAHIAVALRAVTRIGQPSAQQYRKLGVDLLYAMMYTALYFKHHAYESEQEYRLLLLSSGFSPTPAGMQTRARRNELVEYLTLDWKTGFVNALRSIRIGPAADIARAEAFVSGVRAMHLPPGFPIIVDQSSIPFRG